MEPWLSLKDGSILDEDDDDDGDDDDDDDDDDDVDESPEDFSNEPIHSYIHIHDRYSIECRRKVDAQEELDAFVFVLKIQ